MGLSDMFKKFAGSDQQSDDMPMGAIGKLLTMAKLQGGVFMTQQATIRGVHKRHLDQLVADGAIEEYSPGIYRVKK